MIVISKANSKIVANNLKLSIFYMHFATNWSCCLKLKSSFNKFPDFKHFCRQMFVLNGDFMAL